MIYFENIFKSDFLLDKLKGYEKIIIITDSNIFYLYAEKLRNYFAEHSLTCFIISFYAGENNKDRTTKSMIEDFMFEHGFNRNSCIVALGGGVTTDLAGFVAATYFRGIDLILIPTSLLAMVDAAIGGKNGVNTEYGKNIIGTIKQPQAIFIDDNLLLSLPKDEYRWAFSEIVKHAIILDQNYFNDLLNFNHKNILEIIKKSCEIKNYIIKQDLHENNIREILNFGHTIGHAIEQAYNYKISHGQAVAIGIIIESHIAYSLQKLSIDDFELILKIINIFDLNQPFKYKFSVNKIYNAMFADKKIRNNNIRMVLIKKIGEVWCENSNYAFEVDHKIIKKSLEYYASSCM